MRPRNPTLSTPPGINLMGQLFGGKVEEDAAGESISSSFEGQSFFSASSDQNGAAANKSDVVAVGSSIPMEEIWCAEYEKEATKLALWAHRNAGVGQEECEVCTRER